MVLGLVTFWTTRVGPIFELVIHRRAAAVRPARAAVAHAGLGPAARRRAAVQVDVRLPDRGAGRPTCRPSSCSAGWRCRCSGSRSALIVTADRLAVRGPALLRPVGGLTLRPLGRSLGAVLPRRRAERAPVPGELRRPAVPVGVALGTGLAVIGLVFSQTTELNGWSQPELLAVMGVHILHGRGHRHGRSSRTWSGS